MSVNFFHEEYWLQGIRYAFKNQFDIKISKHDRVLLPYINMYVLPLSVPYYYVPVPYVPTNQPIRIEILQSSTYI
jgi:hypothetical protein